MKGETTRPEWNTTWGADEVWNPHRNERVRIFSSSSVSVISPFRSTFITSNPIEFRLCLQESASSSTDKSSFASTFPPTANLIAPDHSFIRIESLLWCGEVAPSLKKGSKSICRVYSNLFASHEIQFVPTMIFSCAVRSHKICWVSKAFSGFLLLEGSISKVPIPRSEWDREANNLITRVEPIRGIEEG
jgi:hypothetical protein